MHAQRAYATVALALIATAPMQPAALSSVQAPSKLLWRARLDQSIARSRKVRGANFVQLATVDASGAPHVRTVVFRGFEPAACEAGCVMRMITDTRSDKVSQLAANPRAELVWWFARSSEQYRVSGPVQLVGAAPSGPDAEALLGARRAQWGNLSDQAREQFFGPPPGMPIGSASASDGAGAVPAGGRGDDGKVLPPPECFALLLLRPRRVDYLCLNGNERYIDVRVEGAASDTSLAEAWTTTHVVG